jgi:hypothetical protein
LEVLMLHLEVLMLRLELLVLRLKLLVLRLELLVLTPQLLELLRHVTLRGAVHEVGVDGAAAVPSGLHDQVRVICVPFEGL